ncbi:signal recognition particle receptor subunit alpha [Candidatus Woesearchaeota archaeon]|nr:signal recognition particle receptor subunit alpha [Candidatus Woesearchaeota archaeon]
MVLEKLGNSLKNTLSNIAKAIFVDDKLINDLVKDIQKSLLQADVNVKLVFDLTSKIKSRISKEETPAGLTKKEHLLNIVYGELVFFLGGEGNKIDIKVRPFRIMLVGLFGAGKTTTAGKLARFYSKRGYKTCLVGLDVHRPAAMSQLEQTAKRINVPSFTDSTSKDALKAYEKFESEIKDFEVIIIDTAGRDALSAGLISEIEALNKKIMPEERLLVISADIGQAAQKQAEQFNASCGITGIIATKMDGTAKAGGALSSCAVTGSPIKFIGVGEKIDDIEEFRPKNFVGRMLGMGDLEALLEKAKEAMTEEQAEDLGKRFLKGEFTLLDLYEQMEAMSKMGPLTKIVDMIPGFGQLKLPKEALQTQEGKLGKWKIAMQSMTEQELEEPDSLEAERIERISKGSGISQGEIRELVKQYRQSKKMVKLLKGHGDMGKMMKKLGGKMPKL